MVSYSLATQDGTKKLRFGKVDKKNFFESCKAKKLLRDYVGTIQDCSRATELNQKNAEAYYILGISKQYIKKYKNFQQLVISLGFIKSIKLF